MFKTHKKFKTRPDSATVADHQEARQYAEAIIDAVREPLLVLDNRQRVFSANKAFYRFFKSDKNETIGRLIYDLGNGQWNIPELKKLLKNILPSKAQIRGFKVSHHFKKIGKKTMLLDAREIVLEGGKTRAVLLAIEDITEPRISKNLLSACDARYRRLFESARDGILILDAKTGMILDANRFLIDLLGFSLKEFLTKTIWDIGLFKDIVANKAQFLKLKKQGYAKYENLPLKTARGKQISVEFVSFLYNVDNHEVIQCNIRDITERLKAEQALKESEEKFRAIFDNAGDGMLLADAKTKKFLFGNRAIRQMLGYNPAEIKNLGVTEIHPKKDLPHVLKQFERQARKEITVAEDLPVKRKDGSVFYVDINSAPVQLAGKAYLLGIFRDITRRKASEESLRQSEEKYRTLADATDDVPYRADNKGTLKFIGSQVKKYGLDSRKMIGKSLLTVIYPADRRRIFGEMIKLLHTGKSALAQFRISNDKGQIFWFEENSTLERDKNGKIIGLVGILRDITARLASEQAIKESEEKYRALYNTSADAIMLLSPEKGFFAGNPATVKMFACKNEAEFIKQTPWTISPSLQPDDQPSPKKAMAMINIALKKGTNFFEWTHRRMTGEDFYATVLLTRMKLGNDTVLQATVRDISAEKAAEQRLLMLSQAVEQAKDGVAVTDMDRKIIFANEAWFKGHGIARAVGALLDDYFQPEEKENYRSLVRFLDTQASMVRGFRCRGAGGLIYPCLVTVSTLKDQKERPFAILHTFRDITDQQTYEQSLKRANSEMKKAYDDVKLAQEKLKEQFEITQRLNRHMVGREIKMKELKEELENCRRGGAKKKLEFGNLN